MSIAGPHLATGPAELKIRDERLRWNFAEWFVLSQTILPALLYLPGTQPLRVPIRMACYGITIAALIYFWRNSERLRLHPAAPWLAASIVYLTLMLAHPTTNSLVAGAAQIGQYVAVYAAVIWAPKLVESPQRLERLLWLVLLCNGISSIVGVLQVYDPDRWMPAEFSSMQMGSEFGLRNVTYEGPDGRVIVRPPGLGDAPGAVASAGVLAMFLGLVFVTTTSKTTSRLLAISLAIFGAGAIFLTMVRASFLIGLIMMVTYMGVEARKGRAGSLLSIVAVSALALSVAFAVALALGGESIYARFATIFEQDATSFYQENRGNQVLQAFVELLPEYPFGAGLGRWGMMYNYFGDPSNIFAPMLWAEIQWPAWIVDGGIFVLLLSGMALFVTLRHAVWSALSLHEARIGRLVAMVLGIQVGLFALTFSYPVFASASGIQFWFLAGALHGVVQRVGRGAGGRTYRA